MGEADRPKRPAWWDWDLGFTPHVEERMLERGFSDVELRTMLDDAGAIEPGRRPGRWMVRTRHSGKSWVVVVEPDEEIQRLIVVTAYPRD